MRSADGLTALGPQALPGAVLLGCSTGASTLKGRCETPPRCQPAAPSVRFACLCHRASCPRSGFACPLTAGAGGVRCGHAVDAGAWRGMCPRPASIATDQEGKVYRATPPWAQLGDNRPSQGRWLAWSLAHLDAVWCWWSNHCISWRSFASPKRHGGGMRCMLRCAICWCSVAERRAGNTQRLGHLCAPATRHFGSPTGEQLSEIDWCWRHCHLHSVAVHSFPIFLVFGPTTCSTS